MAAKKGKKASKPAKGGREKSGKYRADGMPVGVPFKKGHVANPRGRPKIAAEVKALAREYSEDAIMRLVALMMQDDDRRTAKAAADSILDRGIGKPEQAITGRDGAPLIDLRATEARSIVLDVLERLVPGDAD